MLSRGWWLQTLLNYIKERNVYFIISFTKAKCMRNFAFHGEIFF